VLAQVRRFGDDITEICQRLEVAEKKLDAW
jgi:hypothetical protein